MRFNTLKEAQSYYFKNHKFGEKISDSEISSNACELFHESNGTSVCLGGQEKTAIPLVNCKATWSENSGFERDYAYNYTIWEQIYNGFLAPINENAMAIAIIYCDDDLSNISQLEPYEYIVIWSPTRKEWFAPKGKYKKIIHEKYLYDSLL